MDNFNLKIADVRPRWVKLLILLIIGLPPITGWPVSVFIYVGKDLHNIMVWLAYGCFIWLFILLNIGLKHLLKYLSFAFTLALITSLVGAILRKVPSLFIEQTAKDVEYISYKMLSLFVIMISVIPYSLFFINCFSVSTFIANLRFQTNKQYKLKIHMALALRVFQHVGDVMTNLMTVWKEENPLLLKPRFSEELKESKLSYLGWFNWFLNAAITWCFALLIHTFEAIPYLSEEMRLVMNRKQTN